MKYTIEEHEAMHTATTPGEWVEGEQENCTPYAITEKGERTPLFSNYEYGPREDADPRAFFALHNDAEELFFLAKVGRDWGGIVRVQKEIIDEVRSLLLDVFTQATKRGKKYDHGFLGAYEDAQVYLLDHGLITKDECEMRTWET